MVTLWQAARSTNEHYPTFASKLCHAECSHQDGWKSLKSGLKRHQIFLKGFIKGFIKR
jgi:hypothetical protein